MAAQPPPPAYDQSTKYPSNPSGYPPQTAPYPPPSQPEQYPSQKGMIKLGLRNPLRSISFQCF